MKKFNKLTAWLLTLAMLMTFIPSFTALAEESTVYIPMMLKTVDAEGAIIDGDSEDGMLSTILGEYPLDNTSATFFYLPVGNYTVSFTDDSVSIPTGYLPPADFTLTVADSNDDGNGEASVTDSHVSVAAEVIDEETVYVITVTLAPDTSWEGEDGGSTDADPTTYTVTVDDSIANGTVETDVSEAAEGDTVTLTITPDVGYEIDTVSYNDGTNNVEITATEGVYSFTMPASDVTVSASFNAVETAPTEPTYVYNLQNISDFMFAVSCVNDSHEVPSEYNFYPPGFATNGEVVKDDEGRWTCDVTVRVKAMFEENMFKGISFSGHRAVSELPESKVFTAIWNSETEKWEWEGDWVIYEVTCATDNRPAAPTADNDISAELLRFSCAEDESHVKAVNMDSAYATVGEVTENSDGEYTCDLTWNVKAAWEGNYGTDFASSFGAHAPAVALPESKVFSLKYNAESGKWTYSGETASYSVTSAVTIDGEAVAVTDGFVVLGTDNQDGTYSLPENVVGYYIDDTFVDAGKYVVTGGEIITTVYFNVTIINGAQVRYGGGLDENGKVYSGNGLRFLATVDRGNFDAEGYGIRLTAEGSDSYIEVNAEKWQNDTTFSVALTDMAESNYIRKFTATPFVKVSYDDGTEKTIYGTGTVTRSIYQVAAGLLKDETQTGYGLNEVLNAYANQTGIRLVVKSGELMANTNYTTSGAYNLTEDELHFEVSDAEYDAAGNKYSVILTALGNAEIITDNDYWYDYIRINNNNSLIKDKVTVERVEGNSKAVKVTFAADGLIERPVDSNDNTTPDNNDDGFDSESEEI